MADNVSIPVPSGSPVTVDTRDTGGAVQRQVVEVHDDLYHSATTITPNASAYALGNNLGGEKNVTGFARSTSGLLKRVLLKTNFALAVPVFMHVFGDNPSETFTDKSAMPTLGSTTLGFLIKTIPFYSWDQRTNQTLYQSEFEGVDVPFNLASAGSVYFALEMGGAATFGSSKTVWVDFWTKS